MSAVDGASSAPGQGETNQLVVIGASAGGVEALLALVGSLPSSFPAPIVLAQHLDPERRSRLAELLSSRTQLPVRTVASQEPLRAGTIYVIPADCDVEIDDHAVSVLTSPGHAPRPSVDRLLSTAARTFSEGLIAVILTGMGSDGTLGAQAVKAYGGTVIVQNPETAQFPGMPQSVHPSSIDIVANLETIGTLLVDLLTGAYGLPAPGTDDELRPFLERIREQAGLDFTSYKRPTIERRLQRRMASVGAETLTDYRRYVDRHPAELQQLVGSFLIRVTEFFRDPELFEHLREQVMPELIATAREAGELRIWSAGCATGEEAYSLAMLVADLLGDDLGSISLRIFATDVSPEAVDFARRGVYPAAAVAGLPADLVARHFMPRDGSYEVNKSIRSLIIFGEHDLGRRSPFPRIDLVLCRNVLIYFTSELQRRALQLFAFSLRRDGFLVLGKSESVSPLPEYFALAQPRLKIFRRIGAALPLSATQMLDVAPLGPVRSRPVRRAVDYARAHLDYSMQQEGVVTLRLERILEELAAGVVVVNADYDILVINMAARRLFAIQTPAIGEDLIHRVPARLRESLRGAVDTALRGEATTTVVRLVPDLIEGDRGDLEITSSPLQTDESRGVVELVLVQVVDVSGVTKRYRELEAERDKARGELEELQARAAAAITEVRELRIANQRMAAEHGRLRTDIELLQLAQEEAQAAAEEIETLNEEQQATNEELETVNEELQATIEELTTTNDELQARGADLELLASTLDAQRQAGEVERARLEAILTTMGDAVLVVNAAGEVILTNATYERLFGTTAEIRPEDETGQPLPEAMWPQRRAVHGESFTLSFTLPDPDGSRRWFECNGQQVERGDGEPWGVLVIRDITERSLRRQQEQFLAMAAHELRTPLTALSGRLQLLLRRLGTAEVDERLRQDASHALEQARRLETHIHELMDATRAQFGQLVVERVPVDLTARVQEVAEVAQSLARGQQIEVAVPEDPIVVEGDAHRLEQVFLNLLTNAITHAPNTERIDIRLEQHDSAAVVSVQDQGPGIPEEDLPQIFARFFQSRQRRPGHGGLGLGLFIAQEIVSAHGGTIEARSTIGEGTTFTVRLPLGRTTAST